MLHNFSISRGKTQWLKRNFAAASIIKHANPQGCHHSKTSLFSPCSNLPPPPLSLSTRSEYANLRRFTNHFESKWKNWDLQCVQNGWNQQMLNWTPNPKIVTKWFHVCCYLFWKCASVLRNLKKKKTLTEPKKCEISLLLQFDKRIPKMFEWFL